METLIYKLAKILINQWKFISGFKRWLLQKLLGGGLICALTKGFVHTIKFLKQFSGNIISQILKIMGL